MRAVLATQPSVLLFQPQRREHCPDDEGLTDPVYFFGEIECTGCGHLIPVSAQLGEVEIGYCYRWGCGAQLSVAVDVSHLRMDDSRPAATGHGCVCGDPLCRWWEVARC